MKELFADIVVYGGSLGGTLATSVLVDHIQKNGNTFLVLNVYAQQVVSAIGFLVVLPILLYFNKVSGKIKNRKAQEF